MTLVEAIFVAAKRPAAKRGQAERRRAERLEARGIGADRCFRAWRSAVAPNAHGQLAAVRDSIVTAADDLILIASSRNLPDQSRYAGRSAHRVAIENRPVT